MKETNPLVSIITLNYNQTELTLQLLESLQGQSYTNIEIVVCDMKSNEEQIALFSSVSFPNTKILFSNINRGFAGGNNWGIKQSSGEYILLINNDTIADPNLVTNLLAVLKRSEDIAVVSPKIKRFQDRGIVEYAGFKPMNFYTGQTKSIGFNEVDGMEFNIPGETSSVHGCALMIARKTLDAIGGLRDDYFLYYEEWDLSLRIQSKKWKTWYEPSATVYHLGSQSTGTNNPLKEYFLTRNRILLVRRFAAPHQLIVFVLFFTFCSIPLNLFRMITKKQFNLIRSFLKGIAWNLQNSSKPKFDIYSSKVC